MKYPPRNPKMKSSEEKMNTVIEDTTAGDSSQLEHDNTVDSEPVNNY